MLRLATALSRFHYHSKLIRLDLSKKKSGNQPSEPVQERRLPLSEQVRRREKGQEEEVSLRMLKRSMEQQGSSGSKEEQAINHSIKIETKASALYKLHKTRHFAFTSKNLVTLLVKVLELRQINSKQQEPEKLQALLGMVCKKVGKFSPEDMVRLLHSLKKVKVLFSDYRLLAPLIRLILAEFAARTSETNIPIENEFESFYVVSLDTNIKLLHALQFLHVATGSEFEPLIRTLVRSSLFYFHRLVTGAGKERLLHRARDINWSFFISFVRLSGQYEMPVEVTTAFVRALNLHKRAYQGSYDYLFAVEELLHRLPALREHCRGAAIAQHAAVYHVHLFIYELLEKPNELIKMQPAHLLSHARCLTDFTEQEVEALQFARLRATTLERLLRFTLKVFQKFLSSSFSSQSEKDNIERWVLAGEECEFLGEFLLLYHQLAQQKKVRNEAELGQLVKLAQQHFHALSAHSQMVLLRLTLEQQPLACRPLLDLFFGRHQKAGEVRKYKKPLEVDAYARLFPHWSQMGQAVSIAVDAFSEGCFLKLFFARIVDPLSAEQLASHFADRIVLDRLFFSLLIKKYVRVSEFNRSLGKIFSEKAQSQSFKRELESCTILLANERQDRAKLNEFWQMKGLIRRNMRRALSNFSFILHLLEAITRKSGSSGANFSQSTLFKELLFHFNEEVKCLHFRELFTREIYALAGEIAASLQSRNALDESLQICKISKYQECSTGKPRAQMII